MAINNSYLVISDSGLIGKTTSSGKQILKNNEEQKLNLTVTLNVGNSLPKFIDEWDEDFSFFWIEVFNPNPTPSYIKFYTSIGISGTDSILFECGSDIHIDTILPGFNNFTFDRICPEFYTIYWDEFMQHYELGDGFDTGSYFVYFNVRDTLFENVLFQDSVTFSVHDTLSASCLWPYDNTKIFSGLLDSLYFSWTSSNYASSCEYIFEVFLIPSGKDEYYAVDSTTAIFQQIFLTNTCFSSLLNASEYRWELIQSNASGEDLYLIREHTQFGTPGTINVKKFGLDKVDCNDWYKIKLSVRNDCSNWDMEEKLFKIQCPDMVHLDSIFCCPSFSCTNLNIGSTGLNGYSYLWGPEFFRNCLSSYTIANPIFDGSCLNVFLVNGYPFIYTVTITDNFGCTDEKTIYIYGDSPNGSIDTQMVCCGAILKSINGSERKHTFSWYKNSVSPEKFLSNKEEFVVSPNVTTTYYLKLSNACGDYTTSITVSPQSVKKGDIDTLTFNNSVPHDLDFIISYVNATYPNSKYNATNWAIYYLGRWGHSDWAEPSQPVASGSNCNGFNNGEIRWDCKVNGTRLTPGAHNFRVVITNCDLINNTKYQDASCTATPYILRNLKYECRGKISSWVWKYYENHVPHNGVDKCDCYPAGTTTDNCTKADKSTKVTYVLPVGQCICKKHRVAARCLVPNIETSKNCFSIYVE